jgi:hypothetical protein
VDDHCGGGEVRLGAYLCRVRAEYDDDRRAAGVAGRGDGPFDQQSAVVADEGLRPAVTTPATGSENQTSDAQLGAPEDRRQRRAGVAARI